MQYFCLFCLLCLPAGSVSVRVTNGTANYIILHCTSPRYRTRSGQHLPPRWCKASRLCPQVGHKAAAPRSRCCRFWLHIRSEFSSFSHLIAYIPPRHRRCAAPWCRCRKNRSTRSGCASAARPRFQYWPARPSRSHRI